jgi:hypothetical protein
MASHNSGQPWTADLNRLFLIRLRQGTSEVSIAAEFGRSAMSIRLQAENLLSETCSHNKFLKLTACELTTFKEDVRYGKTLKQLAYSYAIPVYAVNEYIKSYKQSMVSAYGGKPVIDGYKEVCDKFKTQPKEPEETKMTFKLFKIETVVRVDGNDVDTYSDDKLIELIAHLEEQVTKLNAIETHSAAIETKIEQLEQNAFALAKILDSRIK